MDDEEAECIHGLGPVSACTICNGREKQAEKARWQIVTVTFLARFDSTCPRCQDPIEEGDLIGGVESGAYIHAECEIR